MGHANEKVLWDDAVSDQRAGYCLGPFCDKPEVTANASIPHWIPMPMFAVTQGVKSTLK